MKKTISLLVIIVLFIIAGFFVFNSMQVLTKHENTKDRISEFPNTYAQLLTEEPILLKELLHDTGFSLVVYYSTTCIYCQIEFEKITKLNQKELVNLSIIAMSRETLINIYNFRDHYNLRNHSNVHFVRDQDEKLFDYFNIKKVPTNFLYNFKGQLLLQTNSLEDVLMFINDQESK